MIISPVQQSFYKDVPKTQQIEGIAELLPTSTINIAFSNWFDKVRAQSSTTGSRHPIAALDEYLPGNTWTVLEGVQFIFWVYLWKGSQEVPGISEL